MSKYVADGGGEPEGIQRAQLMKILAAASGKGPAVKAPSFNFWSSRPHPSLLPLDASVFCALLNATPDPVSSAV
jgi:hypothetical protein